MLHECGALVYLPVELLDIVSGSHLLQEVALNESDRVALLHLDGQLFQLAEQRTSFFVQL